MKTMWKKIASVALAALMVCSLGAVFTGCNSDSGKGNTSLTANNTEFVIGCSGPLTGAAAVYGVAVKNSAEMAVAEINAAGGLNGVKFKFVMTDDMHDATKVATNYASLYEGGMQVSLGTVTTAPGLEWKNLAKDDNVFFLTPSASGDDIPKDVANGYQMCFADGNQGKVAAEYVSANYAGQTIGVLFRSDDAYSTGIYDQFKENLADSVTVVEASFIGDNPSDFSSQIEILRNCKFLFMPIYAGPAALYMVQAKDTMAADTIYYGCDGLDGIESVDNFDINAIPQEVSMLSHFNSKATEGAAKSFIDKYVSTYGTETLNQFGASAYDCVYAIYNAMKKIADADSSKISVTMSASELCELLKAEFNGGFTYSGVTGENITWETTGYVNKTAIRYVMKAASSANQDEE